MSRSSGPRRLFSALLALGALAVARAETSPQRLDDWVEVRSPHFTVFSDAGSSLARTVAHGFEQFRAAMLVELPWIQIDPDKPLVILAARDERTMRQLLPDYWETPGSVRPVGVFLPRADADRAVLRTDASGPQRFQVVYHEYFHLLASVNWPDLPVWLNEGLAELYSHASFDPEGVRTGEIVLAQIRRGLENTPIPIEDLLAADYSSPLYRDTDRVAMFYMQSWLLTHYLMLDGGQGHLEVLDQYLALTRQGLPAAEAAPRAFGDLRELESRLRQYAAGGRSAYRYVRLPALADPDDYTARDVPRAVAASVVGALHVATGRTTEAAALFEEARTLDPELATPADGLALLAYGEGRMDEAGRWAEEAIARSSTNALTYYLAAQMSEGPNEAHLVRAVELRPTFTEAHAALARLLAARDETLVRAYAHAMRAAELEPDALQHAVVAAQILVRLRRWNDAAVLAQRVLDAGPDTGSRREAESVLAAVARARAFEADPDPERRAALVRLAGRITAASCDGLAIDVTVHADGVNTRLHAANATDIEYSKSDAWQPPGAFQPCTHLAGLDVDVAYRPAGGGPYAGELIRVHVRGGHDVALRRLLLPADR